MSLYIKSFVQPSNETVSAFNYFAAVNGLQKPTVISPNGDWPSLALTVSRANQLFGAQFEKFSHASLTEPITRTPTISLPSELIGHVDVVHPSTSFIGRNPRSAQLPFHLHRPDGIVTPTCLQKIYGIPSTPAAQKNNVILVTGYLGASPNRTDLSICSSVCESNVFIPVFPASCPYVTAVGATQGFNPEVATNLIGGGFSDLFPRPWYQTQAVDGFLKTIPPDFAGTFNKLGRGYPDVAVQWWGLDFVVKGIAFVTGETSFSSPIFASIVALINDRLVAAGKPVLGFLNPWLYANSKAFTDITEGHNSGLECPASSVAFDATKGWDALTGVGSPVFDKFLAAAFEY
ncbi:peptidase S8/S53 domain-containing protein [Mycena rebaudengoi]|nr:peptidase S8/S53 domain-containing protein [Mycena rebaudengoi]